MYNFEKAIAYLIPACPVSPIRKTIKAMAYIAGVELKTGCGKSGVKLRCPKSKSWNSVTIELFYQRIRGKLSTKGMAKED